jgi:hypothetical protein
MYEVLEWSDGKITVRTTSTNGDKPIPTRAFSNRPEFFAQYPDLAKVAIGMPYDKFDPKKFPRG